MSDFPFEGTDFPFDLTYFPFDPTYFPCELTPVPHEEAVRVEPVGLLPIKEGPLEEKNEHNWRCSLGQFSKPESWMPASGPPWESPPYIPCTWLFLTLHTHSYKEGRSGCLPHPPYHPKSLVALK